MTGGGFIVLTNLVGNGVATVVVGRGARRSTPSGSAGSSTIPGLWIRA